MLRAQVSPRSPRPWKVSSSLRPCILRCSVATPVRCCVYTAGGPRRGVLYPPSRRVMPRYVSNAGGPRCGILYPPSRRPAARAALYPRRACGHPGTLTPGVRTSGSAGSPLPPSAGPRSRISVPTAPEQPLLYQGQKSLRSANGREREEQQDGGELAISVSQEIIWSVLASHALRLLGPAISRQSPAS